MHQLKQTLSCLCPWSSLWQYYYNTV